MNRVYYRLFVHVELTFTSTLINNHNHNQIFRQKQRYQLLI